MSMARGLRQACRVGLPRNLLRLLHFRRLAWALVLLYFPLASGILPVALRWHPGGGPVLLPCCGLNLLRLRHLWCSFCIYGLVMKACEPLLCHILFAALAHPIPECAAPG